MTTQSLYRLDQIKRVVEEDKVILDIDSLSLPQGELTAIAGPNGAGKSTLLNLLAFLTKPDQGFIHFKGKPVRVRDFFQLRRQVTMVHQAPYLFPGSVFENVAYGLRVRSVPRQQRSHQVEEALSMVDLSGYAERAVKGLSGGETQRVAIARALVFKPLVVLLDEPTAGVDAARVDMVESLILNLCAKTDVSVLFSTHNLDQAHRLTERVIHLKNGRMVSASLDKNQSSRPKSNRK
jgi:tungstate transport system ATP-binding protein